MEQKDLEGEKLLPKKFIFCIAVAYSGLKHQQQQQHSFWEKNDQGFEEYSLKQD